MGYYVSSELVYYEGDRISASDIAVDPGPSARHVWTGSAWQSGPAVALEMRPLDFLDLFTEAEQLAVVQASLSNAAVKLWYDRVLAATYITLDDPRVETGLAALTAAGLLSEERKLAVLAAMLKSE